MSDEVVGAPARPTSREELFEEARRLAGKRLGTLAANLGEEVPGTLRRAKGWVGRLLEECLGADGGNYAGPDFRRLKVELKTLPVDRVGHVKESTYLGKVDLLGKVESWEASRAREKLATVLWIPILVEDGLAIADRVVGHPLLWSPNAEEEALLKADWEFHMDLIRRGLVDTITGRDGEVLQIRPKAATARALTATFDEEGNRVMTLPRGFYLRPSFTQALLMKNFSL